MRLQYHNLRLLAVILIVFCALLKGPAWSAEPSNNYRSVTGPCEFQFPDDHGPHPGYRTEWWYYTGNLTTKRAARYGFQLTFFRSQLSPPGADRNWPASPSAWRTQQLFLAHAALSDIQNQRFHHSERMARAALGMAGASVRDQNTTVFLKNWTAQISVAEHRLRTEADGFAYDLSLHPLKPPTPHGDSGYSRKGSSPESASCYYSFTRLQVQGRLTVNGETVPVSGTAWMDHEFSSAPLESDLAGWDWFSLQLGNGTEVMIYLLRRSERGYSPASSGTFVDAQGKSTHLSRDMFELEALDHWKSPHSGATYPARWQLRVPSLELNLTIVPAVADQELQTPETTRVTYWEGSVSVLGSAGNEALQGVGYVELTGYAKPFDAPM